MGYETSYAYVIVDTAAAESRGVGAHRERDAARPAGFLEVIEHDAFMVTWLRQVPAVPPAFVPVMRRISPRSVAACARSDSSLSRSPA